MWLMKKQSRCKKSKRNELNLNFFLPLSYILKIRPHTLTEKKTSKEFANRVFWDFPQNSKQFFLFLIFSKNTSAFILCTEPRVSLTRLQLHHCRFSWRCHPDKAASTDHNHAQKHTHIQVKQVCMRMTSCLTVGHILHHLPLLSPTTPPRPHLPSPPPTHSGTMEILHTPRSSFLFFLSLFR